VSAWQWDDEVMLRESIRDDAVWLSAQGRVEGAVRIAAHLRSTRPDPQCRIEQHGAHAALRSGAGAVVIEIRADQVVFGADASR
jgi:hypothetical protein